MCARDGVEQPITVTPEQRGEIAMIGVTLANATRTFHPGLRSARSERERNIEFSALIMKTVGGLFAGETSPRQLMGPSALRSSPANRHEGWVALFGLMASISLNLGLLNLLPIPVLDGGHILIMGLEAVARRDFCCGEREDVPRGLRAADGVDGHGHLQRPDPDRMGSNSSCPGGTKIHHSSMWRCLRFDPRIVDRSIYR